MYNTFIIIFRETLEAALFVGIVAAAISGISSRKHILGMGIGLGVAGSVLLASVSGYLAQALDGLGQDLAQALILISAILMLAWHCITSQVHGRAASKEASSLGKQLVADSGAGRLIIAALALTILREGAEAVLFVMGATSDTSINTNYTQLFLAVSLGIFAGSLSCYAMFRGLKAFSVKTMFKTTHILLVLFVGAMASRLAKLCVSSGWVDNMALSNTVWDIESILPSKSGVGLIINALLGYDSQPVVLQLLAYVVAIVAVVIFSKLYTAKYMSAYTKPATQLAAT
jgi:high-affinity iron transporter